MIVHSPLRRYQVRQRPQHLLSRFPVAIIVFLFIKAAAEETNVSWSKRGLEEYTPRLYDVMKSRRSVVGIRYTCEKPENA